MNLLPSPRLRPLLWIFFFVGAAAFPGRIAAESAWIGQTGEGLEQVIGPPHARAEMGTREIWTYANGATVYLRDGRIERIRGSLPDPLTEATTPQGPAASISPPQRNVMASKRRGTETFRVPQPTIVTEPGFQAPGNWGGLSDGKTLGVDGRPLANHQIYANDCVYFERRMMRGLRESMGEEALRRVQDLRGILSLPDRVAQNAAAERYASRWRQSAREDRLMAFAVVAESLSEAHAAYREAIAELHRFEEIEANERIDLNITEVSSEGRHWRQQAQKAISAMATARTRWLENYRRVYEIGAEAERAETSAAAKE